MTWFSTPTVFDRQEFNLPVETLQKMPCGLHRVALEEASSLLPEMAPFFKEIPFMEEDKWEVDVKIHMLMKGQYPCIPNWHCDNVPRVKGNLQWQEATDEQNMYLWVSGKPTTEFLAEDFQTGNISTHGELAESIIEGNPDTFQIPEQTWVGMSQLTPHRGTVATENCWRIFVRVTDKKIMSVRPQISKIRRHCQVYLPYDFHW